MSGREPSEVRHEAARNEGPCGPSLNPVWEITRLSSLFGEMDSTMSAALQLPGLTCVTNLLVVALTRECASIDCGGFGWWQCLSFETVNEWVLSQVQDTVHSRYLRRHDTETHSVKFVKT